MVKTLAKSIQEYKTPSILSPIFVSLEVIVECIMPLFIMRFIEEISNGKDSNSLPMEIILYYGGILVGMALLSLTFGMLSGRFAARASADLPRT